MKILFILIAVVASLQMAVRLWPLPALSWLNVGSTPEPSELVTFGGYYARRGDVSFVQLKNRISATPRVQIKWPWRLRLISATLTAMLCAYLIMPAWKYVSIGAMQTSPAMTLRMDYVHFTVFGLLVTLLLFSVFRVSRMVFASGDGKADVREDLV